MKLGAEPKKVGFLAVLLLLAGYLFVSNWTDSGTSPSTPAPAATTTPVSNPAPAQTASTTASANQMTEPPPNISRRASSSQAFKPSLRPRRAEDRPDPTTVDPTLRLDLLAKLSKIGVDGIDRSLFDFGAPPPPPTPEPKITPEPEEPKPAPPPKPTTPVKPPPPPIQLKYYGYLNPNDPTDKRAFFMQGEDIYVAKEGELIDDRYKVVRIGVTSAVLNDTQYDNEQSLPIVAELRR